MAASDLRVPMSVCLDAFGVPITVTRPAPENTPVSATGIWLPDFMEDIPAGTSFQRREPRRVLAVSLQEVGSLPRGTVIEAPLLADGPLVRWRVDAFDRIDSDHARVTVVEAPEVEQP